MMLQKSEDFVADVEEQYEWHVVKAGYGVADHYLGVVEATCRLLESYPLIGPTTAFKHPRLQGWRFFVAGRPFRKHVLFYEIVGDAVVMRRAMHGHRNLRARLLNRHRE